MSVLAHRLLPVTVLAIAVLAVTACAGRPAPSLPHAAPSLPLPSPQPEGLEALPEHVRYVALGDSIATGAGATTSYVHLLAGRLRSDLGREVEVANLAVNGWTSGDLLQALRSDAGMRAAVASADLVTWNIGGNDLLRVLAEIAAGTCGQGLVCVRTTVDTLVAQWDGIVAEILALRRDDDVVLRTIDVYHPFVMAHRQAGVFEALAPFLQQVNDHIAAAGGRGGIRVAPVHVAFNGPDRAADPAARSLLAPDGVHPSDAGHAVIAQTLFELD